ncbi:MAG: iron dependent repressor, metal binding and dimerization domain protein [bacterium]|nr:iron dependent repressor, metal binding and dimerization domain protein [bacterium]
MFLLHIYICHCCKTKKEATTPRCRAPPLRSLIFPLSANHTALCPALVIIDAARELSVSKQSVSRACANTIYESHSLITRFLADTLGVSKKTAETGVCRVEHIIGSETFEKIKGHISPKLL